MKKIIPVLILLTLSLLNTGWLSETGSEVVSDLEVIVRTSLEATQVFTSDQLSLLYGETRLGGTSRYASFDSGGILSTRNINSSTSVIKLGNDDYLEWLDSSGSSKKLGVSSDDSFVFPASMDITGPILIGQDRFISAGGTDGNIQIYAASAQATIVDGGSGASVPGTLVLGKSRSSNSNYRTIVNNNDLVGKIKWVADDGVDMRSVAAHQYAYIDLAPGANSVPSTMVWGVTMNGKSDPTDIMYLTYNKYLGLNVVPVEYLHVSHDNVHGGIRISRSNGTTSSELDYYTNSRWDWSLRNDTSAGGGVGPAWQVVDVTHVAGTTQDYDFPRLTILKGGKTGIGQAVERSIAAQLHVSADQVSWNSLIVTSADTNNIVSVDANANVWIRGKNSPYLFRTDYDLNKVVITARDTSSSTFVDIKSDAGNSILSVFNNPSAGDEVVVNESAQDVDFRVETQASANALTVDSGSNAMNIRIPLTVTIVSGDADSFGTVVIAAANQVCTTTCGNNAALMGHDTGTGNWVNIDDNTADQCLCTG